MPLFVGGSMVVQIMCLRRQGNSSALFTRHIIYAWGSRQAHRVCFSFTPSYLTLKFSFSLQFLTVTHTHLSIVKLTW